MKVIRAQKKHISDISKLMSALDTKDYSFSDKKHVEDFIVKGWYYIALQKNEMTGAMALEPIEGSYQIYSITSTKKGVGKALIDFAIKKCKDEKVAKLWCWSLKRYKAKGFYEKMGFEEFFLLRKQWYGEDCYFFGKIIK